MGLIVSGGGTGSGNPTAQLTSISYKPRTAPLTEITYSASDPQTAPLTQVTYG